MNPFFPWAINLGTYVWYIHPHPRTVRRWSFLVQEHQGKEAKFIFLIQGKEWNFILSFRRLLHWRIKQSIKGPSWNMCFFSWKSWKNTKSMFSPNYREFHSLEKYRWCIIHWIKNNTEKKLISILGQFNMFERCYIPASFGGHKYCHFHLPSYCSSLDVWQTFCLVKFDHTYELLYKVQLHMSL